LSKLVGTDLNTIIDVMLKHQQKKIIK
jgi:hypothetical protein